MLSHAIGYAKKCENGRYIWTEKSNLFYEQNKLVESEGCISQLMRLSKIFTKLEMKSGCRYYQYFTKHEYELALPSHKILDLILNLLNRLDRLRK